MFNVTNGTQSDTTIEVVVEWEEVEFDVVCVCLTINSMSTTTGIEFFVLMIIKIIMMKFGQLLVVNSLDIVHN